MISGTVFRLQFLTAPLLLLASGGQAFASDLPPVLFEYTEEAFLTCQTAGGEAQIGEGYSTTADLNADGVPDFITDLSAVDCAGAPNVFCNNGACPVDAWLSTPDGGHTRFEIGPALSFSLTEQTDGRTRVQTAHTLETCADANVESTNCAKIWNFSGAGEPTFAFAQSDADAPRSRPADLVPVEKKVAVEPDAAAQTGWSLRAVPGASPVALAFGPGNIYNVAAFCLADAPFIALRFREPPTDETLSVQFSFGGTFLTAEALHEETAGGAYIIDLTANDLAEGLAGSSTSTTISVDDTDQGTMSLEGSTRTIRTALETCYAF
ncbi:hypothetical protein [Amaricoccus tamworthensis]|uniref:hypothetical protein n=1 Tax=Amaricoccus tamworthensis TaxID=57002 RepID=UPI003C7C77B1